MCVWGCVLYVCVCEQALCVGGGVVCDYVVCVCVCVRVFVSFLSVCCVSLSGVWVIRSSHDVFLSATKCCACVCLSLSGLFVRLCVFKLWVGFVSGSFINSCDYVLNCFLEFVSCLLCVCVCTSVPL